MGGVQGNCLKEGKCPHAPPPRATTAFAQSKNYMIHVPEIKMEAYIITMLNVWVIIHDTYKY